MKSSYLFILGCVGAVSALSANAQETVMVSETESLVFAPQSCKTQYYTTAGDNWFIQLGAGIQTPFVENHTADGKASHHLTTAYNVGFGKWFSPYIGWRASFLGGALHWDNNVYSKSKYVNGNVDIMWDMFNSLGGVNSNRVFSVVPFVGIGGTYVWDYKPAGAGNAINDHGAVKHNEWLLPVSAGIQLRFRLCRYVDFFAEGRAQFYGDAFNNYNYGKPVDVNISAIGGFSFNLGGSEFKSYNSCDYMNYIANLNSQVNDLRGALATTTAALAAAEAQLPCPEATVTETVQQNTPLMATVRFKINSAIITPEEQVNVYNVAQWMKSNEANVLVIGYADKDTGSSDYNMNLSKRRAQAVYDMLTGEYNIPAERLSIRAEGSNSQPYSTNNWNRIVIFEVK